MDQLGIWQNRHAVPSKVGTEYSGCADSAESRPMEWGLASAARRATMPRCCTLFEADRERDLGRGLKLCKEELSKVELTYGPHDDAPRLRKAMTAEYNEMDGMAEHRQSH